MNRLGYFLIADISGYTEFLAGSELEHAQAIMQALLGSLVGAIAAPMRLAKIEGDAVFCHARADAVVRPQTVLDGIDDLYSRFSATLEHTLRNTTCPCRACRCAGSLGLKFVLHYGEAVEDTIAGRSELTGTAVIAVHRLMKNGIREATGIEAYRFVTNQAATALGGVEGIRHEETVDGIGTIAGVVTDMAPVWQQRREAERAWVAPDAAPWFPATRLVLPIAPSEVWTYLFDTGLRLRWVGGMTGMTIDGPLGKSTMRKGTMLHCAHGAEMRDFEIVDWRPFESVSLDRRLPYGVVTRLTFDLTPLADGRTQLDARVQPVSPGNLLGRLTLPRLRAKAERGLTQSLATLSRIVAESADAPSVPRLG